MNQRSNSITDEKERKNQSKNKDNNDLLLSSCINHSTIGKHPNIIYPSNEEHTISNIPYFSNVNHTQPQQLQQKKTNLVTNYYTPEIMNNVPLNQNYIMPNDILSHNLISYSSPSSPETIKTKKRYQDCFFSGNEKKEPSSPYKKINNTNKKYLTQDDKILNKHGPQGLYNEEYKKPLHAQFDGKIKSNHLNHFVIQNQSMHQEPLYSHNNEKNKDGESNTFSEKTREEMRLFFEKDVKEILASAKRDAFFYQANFQHCMNQINQSNENNNNQQNNKKFN